MVSLLSPTTMAFSKPQTKFDCEFVNELIIDIQTDCPVCLQVLFEPYKVTCCGKSFCQPCIERIKADQQACPTCREENFSCFLNEELQNSIHQLLVRCTYRNKGCEWTGELGELEDHLNQCPNPDNQLQGCEFTEINCAYCFKCFKRKEKRQGTLKNNYVKALLIRKLCRRRKLRPAPVTVTFAASLLSKARMKLSGVRVSVESGFTATVLASL